MAPTEGLPTRLTDLDPERRPALVERLYRERGWRVADSDAPDGWVGLRVVSPAGRRRRLLVATEAAPTPQTTAADRVVRLGNTERGDADATAPARVVDAAAVAEQIRYALTPAAQRRLARTVFDTDRATLLNRSEQTQGPPDRTPEPPEQTPEPPERTRETPQQTQRPTEGGREPPDREPSAAETGTAAPEAESGADDPQARRRWVALGGLLLVAVIVLAAGGPLSALGGFGVDDGGDTVSFPAFDPGGPPEARGVSGLTPTPGNVAPGPDGATGAGNGSRGGGADDTAGDAPTATDAAARTDAMTRTDATTGTNTTGAGDGRVPGVDAEGLDETVLAERTAAVLANQSYRFVAVYREEVDGVTTTRLREVARVENDSRYVSRVSRLGEPVGSPQVIADTTVSARDGRVVRQVVGDGVVRRERPTAGDPFQPRVAQYVEWYLGVESSTVVDSERRDGSRRLLLRLRGDPWPGVENTTGSAVVTDAGLVRSVTRRYTLPGRPNVTATVTVRITGVGETTVDPALNGTSEGGTTAGSRDERDTRDTRTHHPAWSAVASQSHHSAKFTLASQSHHSTR